MCPATSHVAGPSHKGIRHQNENISTTIVVKHNKRKQNIINNINNHNHKTPVFFNIKNAYFQHNALANVLAM